MMIMKDKATSVVSSTIFLNNFIIDEEELCQIDEEMCTQEPHPRIRFDSVVGDRPVSEANLPAVQVWSRVCLCITDRELVEG